MISVLVDKIVKTEKISLEDIFKTSGKVYTFLNPVSYLTALENINIFSSFDGIFVDGSLLVTAIKYVYNQKITRRSFDMTSLAPKLLEFAEKHEKSLYIIASKQEQVEKVVGKFRQNYPSLKIIGYRNGYFSSARDMDIEAMHIATMNPYFLIVGMGTLTQERFLLKVKDFGYKGIGFTCGGFIHQTAENEINYYPDWIDKTNMRFLYRMYKEKHTRKRYLQAAVLFPFKFIFEKLFSIK